MDFEYTTPDYFEDFKLTHRLSKSVLESQVETAITEKRFEDVYDLYSENLIESVEIGFTKYVILIILQYSFLFLALVFMTNFYILPIFGGLSFISLLVSKREKRLFDGIHADLYLTRYVVDKLISDDENEKKDTE